MSENNSNESAPTETYSAKLVGADSTETIELPLISGLPQKSIVRASTEGGTDGVDDQVWELDPDSDSFEYRPAGIPGADYS
ncbi:hypothetical protein B0I08_102370 [Glaciihabitans tibetensis]|uniref:Uncharacterized protein n=1 Tax=Glaciihabitans tibetensis TaxID=1266600 RepID=A0A2T0VHZ7_9MICO|nr:hypothetical protein [Glaciihabitans tibetensis]PRY69693.1 hypothetical protein B0I08_102370 [Glaciihabitans tibetensis]